MGVLLVRHAGTHTLSLSIYIYPTPTHRHTDTQTQQGMQDAIEITFIRGDRVVLFGIWRGNCSSEWDFRCQIIFPRHFTFVCLDLAQEFDFNFFL